MSHIAQEQSIVDNKFNTEWLQSFQGFEDHSTEEAKEELESLKQLAEIVCQHLLNTS